MFRQFICRSFGLNHRRVHICIFIYDEKCTSACSVCEEIRFSSWGRGQKRIYRKKGPTANRMSQWLEVLRPQDPIGQSVLEAIRNTSILFLWYVHMPFLGWKRFHWYCEISVASVERLFQVIISNLYEPGIQSFQIRLYNGLWFTTFLLILSPWATEILQVLNNSDGITV